MIRHWDQRHVNAALRWAGMGIPYKHIGWLLCRTERAVKHAIYNARNA